MKRINPFTLYENGIRLSKLNELSDDPNLKDRGMVVLYANVALNSLIDSDEIGLRVSRADGLSLRKILVELIEVSFDFQQRFTPEQVNKKFEDNVWKLRGALAKFEHVLAAELQDMHSYVFPQTGIASVSSLVESADSMFSESIRDRLPEPALEDIRQAGRCLVFELFTACGFHLFRATESVMKAYAVHLGVESKSQGAAQNWGVMLKALKEKAGHDPAIVRVLEEIKDFHRNPLVHPEETMDVDEANALLAICQNVILAMAKVLPNKATQQSPQKGLLLELVSQHVGADADLTSAGASNS